MPALNINDYWIRWLQMQLPSTITTDGTTAVQASSGNVANANAIATLPAQAGHFTYISGFTATASGSTSALAVTLTITNVGTTMNYTFVFPAGVGVPAQPLTVNFNPPIPASAVNTTIVVTLPPGGAGNTNASVTAWGFQL
jgi:hypothetical protein